MDCFDEVNNGSLLQQANIRANPSGISEIPIFQVHLLT